MLGQCLYLPQLCLHIALTNDNFYLLYSFYDFSHVKKLKEHHYIWLFGLLIKLTARLFFSSSLGFYHLDFPVLLLTHVSI